MGEDTWAGSRAATHGHLTGAHLGDAFWRALIAHPEVVARRAAVPQHLLAHIARHCRPG